MKNYMKYLTVAVALLLPSAFASAQDAAPTVSQHDKLKIAAQKICPVMGKPLGSMGSPVKVKLGDEEVFLCCKACATKQVSREHWATIHANFRNAQGKCPVMGKDLPVGAKWDGRRWPDLLLVLSALHRQDQSRSQDVSR